MLDMGIIKVEVNLSELTQAIESFRRDRLQALEALGSEIRLGVEQYELMPALNDHPKFVECLREVVLFKMGSL